MTESSCNRRGRFASRVFNPGLYLEGLLRLWLPGLVVCIPTALLSAVLGTTRTGWDYSLLSLLQIALTVLMPILLLSVFSFLRSRREADLRFSAPVTRTCLYVSYCLSMLTVCLLLTAVPLLCTALTYRIGPTNVKYPIEFSNVMQTVGLKSLNNLCCCFMLCGVMAVAVALSGSVGHSLFLYALFTLTPTAVRSAAEHFYSKLPLTADWIHPLEIRLPLERLFDLVSYDAPPKNLPKICIPALCIGLVCFVIGGLLFRRYRAEDAGRPAAGRRVLLLTVCLLTVMMTVLICCTPGTTDWVWPTAGLAALYSVYILLTTRKISFLWRTLPCLGITLAVTALAFFGSYRIVGGVRLAKPLEADEVEGVSIAGPALTSVARFSDFNIEKRNPLDIHKNLPSEALIIREQDVIDRVAELFNKDRVSRVKRLNIAATGLKDNPQSLRVTYSLKDGRKLSYNVSVEASDMAELGKMYSEAAERLYERLIVTLPSGKASSVNIKYCSFYNGKMVVDKYLYDDPQLTELEQTFRREYESLSDSQRRRLILVDESYGIRPGNSWRERYSLSKLEAGERAMYLNIRFEDSFNSGYYSYFLHLDPYMLPETYRLICTYYPLTKDFMAGKNVDMSGR